jgi:GxxExxY protein
MPAELPENERVKSIVGAFFDVFNYFGFGLTETLYMTALEHELCLRGHAVARELRVPIYYKERRIGWQRLDMVVDGRVIVEGKASEKLPPPSRHQIVTYLHATIYEVGLLLHFGPRPSFQRFVESPKRRPGFATPQNSSAHRHADGSSHHVPLIERNVPDGRAGLRSLGELQHHTPAPGLAPPPDGARDTHEGVGVDVHDAAQVEAHGEHPGS